MDWLWQAARLGANVGPNRRTKDYHSKFNRKECVNFVPAPVNPSEPEICYCGLYEREHANPTTGFHPIHSRRFALHEPFTVLNLQKSIKRATTPGGKWHQDRDIKEFPTDAYGMLFFKQEPKGSDCRFFKVAHYIRLSDETRIWRSPRGDPSVLQLLVGTWNLLEPEHPKLVISFAGDEERFSLEGAKKKTFMAGLIRAVESTNAWLLTDGSDAGISKVVGQTVNEMQTTIKTDGRLMPYIKCIGVTSYGSCRNKDSLVNAEELTENEQNEQKHFYDTTRTPGQVAKIALNGDHTHFLLVDDGFHNSLSSADSFRSRLEEAIQKTMPEGLDIPVVMLLLDGSLRAIDRCLKALRRRVPVVVVQGSGRAADLIADAVLNHDPTKSDDGALKEIMSKVPIYIDDLDDHKHMECAKKVLECCRTGNKITVYDIDRDSNMDKAILSALLTGTADPEDELRLALEWDRPDVAESSIFPQIDDNADLRGIMKQALREEKTDFVDLLISWGFDIKRFLTVEELRKLYNLPEPKVHLKMLLHHSSEEDQITLSDIDKLLKKVVGAHVHTLYHDRNKGKQFSSSLVNVHFEDPYMELFIWAILTRRNKLADFLWEITSFPLSAAVVATCIYNGILASLTDTDLRTESQDMKDMFEEKAIELSDLGYRKSYNNAVSLMQQRYSRWGGLDILELAMVGQDMRFVSSPSARADEIQRWTNVRRKFWSRILYRILLFVAHCFLVLFNLDETPTILEGILAIIVTSEAIEKMIQMAQTTQRIGNSAWHWYDTGLLVVFLSAFVLRSIPWIPDFGYVLYALCAPLFSLRLLRFFYVWPRLGSKILIFVYMVPRMVEFLIFLLLFVLGYGIATRVLVSHTCQNREYLNFSLRSLIDFISEVIFFPYWQMFGELQLDSLEASNLTTCKGEKGHWRWLTSCDPCEEVVNRAQPVIYDFFAKGLLAVYLLISNVLLLNLIIAIFTTIYERVQTRSIEHWNYEMHRLTREYENKPVVPPPFGLLAYVWRGIWLTCCQQRGKELDPAEVEVCDETDVWLSQFERQQVRSYNLMRSMSGETSLENTLLRLNKMIESLPTLINRGLRRDDPTTLQRPQTMADEYHHYRGKPASFSDRILGKTNHLDQFLESQILGRSFKVLQSTTTYQSRDATTSLAEMVGKSFGVLKQMALEVNFWAPTCTDHRPDRRTHRGGRTSCLTGCTRLQEGQG
ncbi:transient receptor potential cation channel subfamily M member-like 2 [Penaeus japonicus]|uniref:transient receptor potential cation channel subfamily M member-like 2 n=1 Tax=Penaeus japonicus TaxID=27405 RepID=UPI001C70C33C|nr:transient receptor potential cation channel subfamily M member-like 2 [Penaeus japonicus]